LPLESEVDADSQRAEETLSDARNEAKQQRDRARRRLREILDELIAEYDAPSHGMEIRQVAGGYRMSTKPEHHDVVRSFARSLKPPVRLSLQALETLAVIAYKQPVTAPEISELRGVDSTGVIASLLSRKLITTAGRKQVIGRPILYKTTKDFLMRFGLKDLGELPSIEEFEKLTSAAQSDLFPASDVRSDATGVSDVPAESESAEEKSA
jgi:segregation and condensation protein B